MEHGIQSYFEERFRNLRRLSALTLTIAVVLLAPLLLVELTPLGARVRHTRIMRFGFEGPPRYVELVQIDAQPTTFASPENVGKVDVRSARTGANRGGEPASRRHRPAIVRAAPDPTGVSDAGRDLVARAIASRGHVPIFQSSDLIIETLVRPQYPEDARARGIEGHVAVLAHVDTLGRVVEAEVMNTSGEGTLDAASRSAVMQCKFRPYRDGDRSQDVYAVFRFSFRIY